MTSPKRMSLPETLSVLHALRTDQQIVVTTMSPAREWMNLGSHPLDFVYAPSSMGQAPGLGLGLALAQPDKQVIVCNGDGCMLMNLGSLVTATTCQAENYVLVLFDNDVYEVTGMQPTAASPRSRPEGTDVDWCGIARSSGFRRIYNFDDLADWKTAAPEVLAAKGPTFVRLCTEPMPGALVPKSSGPAPARAAAFAAAVQKT